MFCDLLDFKLLPPLPQNSIKSRRSVFLIIYFHNPGIEQVNISKLLRLITDKVPENFKHRDVPTVVYKRSPTIARKIFNYKQTVLSIPDNFTELKNECKCHTSRFCDPVHGHVVTGDLRIISNNKLRSLLTKGPKESIRWNKVLQCITQGVLNVKRIGL